MPVFEWSLKDCRLPTRQTSKNDIIIIKIALFKHELTHKLCRHEKFIYHNRNFGNVDRNGISNNKKLIINKPVINYYFFTKSV